jgi:hypothetical protein
MADANPPGSVAPSIHASAVLVGPRAVLIRGPSGSGKSRLAFALLQAAEEGRLAFARLVSDDRTRLEVVFIASSGKTSARTCRTDRSPWPGYQAGALRATGAIVFMVVDLAADAPRLPETAKPSGHD